MSTKMIYFAIAAVLLYVLFGQNTTSGSPTAPGALAVSSGVGHPASPGSLTGIAAGIGGLFSSLFGPKTPAVPGFVAATGPTMAQLTAPYVAPGTTYGPTLMQLGIDPTSVDLTTGNLSPVDMYTSDGYQYA